jgi:ubiquinol-cytochrome c reductase cytochrome c subunit
MTRRVDVVRVRPDGPGDVRRRRSLAGGLVVLFAAVGACTAARPPSPAPYQARGVEQEAATADGQVLYERDCAWCHGGQGQGTTFGPNLDGALDGGAYTDFMLSTGRMPLDSPRQRAMRSDPRYDDAQIAAIVAYVSSFGGSGPPVPEPNPAAGDLSRGEQLYQENCAACHGITGIGGALTSGRFAPPLDQATPTEVAEAMLVGPGCSNSSRTCGPGSGAMPRFELTPDEVDAITRYVLYVQSPRDAGGWSIGRVGPVAEGAVGLLVGLGLLLIVIRWIGTSSEQEAED